jgi:hypothetical protein
MKRKHPISEEHKHCATEREAAGNPVRNPELDRVFNLGKQYEELCRLREQVQIAESRQRVITRGSSHDGGR